MYDAGYEKEGMRQAFECMTGKKYGGYCQQNAPNQDMQPDIEIAPIHTACKVHQ